MIKPFLVRDVSKWWTAVWPTVTLPVSWIHFKDQFMAHFFPSSIKMQCIGMSVVNCTYKFTMLGIISPTIIANKSLKMLRYKNGWQSKV